MHRYLVVTSLLCLSTAACKKENPAYCEQTPTPADCDQPDSSDRCTDDTMCPGEVCDVASGTCVECTTANPAACTAATPVCDATDHTCRTCEAHSECASNACLPDGTCAPEAQVAYVAASGSGTECSRTAPCGPLATALATARPVVKIESDPVKDTDVITISAQTVTIVAAAGTTLRRDGTGPILRVQGPNTDVAISDLRIAEATGVNMGANGIDLAPNGGAPKLTLTRVKIDTNQGGGISSTGGTLTVTQSELSGNQGGGISSTGGTLTVTQSELSGNQGGGISVTGTGATFRITNNFIVRNGSTSSAIGGLYLGAGTGSASLLGFNTIVDNEVTTGAANSGGVVCLNVGFAASNNIIARNFVNNNATVANANTFGDCTYDSSNAIAVSVDTFQFEEADMTPYDYHLTAGSAAIDQATTTSAIVVDIDGQPRPHGAQKDQGADEYVP
jgi:hypothetical protein